MEQRYQAITVLFIAESHDPHEFDSRPQGWEPLGKPSKANHLPPPNQSSFRTKKVPLLALAPISGHPITNYATYYYT